MSNWIKKAIGTHKGGLHRSLGIPMSQRIPAKKLAAATHMKGKVGKEARLAMTLAKLRRH